MLKYSQGVVKDFRLEIIKYERKASLTMQVWFNEMSELFDVEN